MHEEENAGEKQRCGTSIAGQRRNRQKFCASSPDLERTEPMSRAASEPKHPRRGRTSSRERHRIPRRWSSPESVWHSNGKATREFLRTSRGRRSCRSQTQRIETSRWRARAIAVGSRRVGGPRQSGTCRLRSRASIGAKKASRTISARQRQALLREENRSHPGAPVQPGGARERKHKYGKRPSALIWDIRIDARGDRAPRLVSGAQPGLVRGTARKRGRGGR